MAFEATKREWSELYVLFKLLVEGTITEGSSDGQPLETASSRMITSVIRSEQAGIRHYHIMEQKIEITTTAHAEKNIESAEGQKTVQTFPRHEFRQMLPHLLDRLRQEGERVEATEEIEQFLDRIALYDLHALTQDVSDLQILFADAGEVKAGCKVWSRIPHATRVLDGGRAANLKLEQTGAKFASPEVAKINAMDTAQPVADRMRLIGQLGGILKYNEPADRVFRANLAMIDLHLGRLLTEMVRLMHEEGIVRMSDLTERMKILNPLKINTDLIEKHHYYAYKIKQLLCAVALGMRPAKIYTGVERTPDFFILMNTDGSLVSYPVSNRTLWSDFLFRNTRLEKTPPGKAKYGLLERENGKYYFKLNLKISFTKR